MARGNGKTEGWGGAKIRTGKSKYTVGKWQIKCVTLCCEHLWRSWEESIDKSWEAWGRLWEVIIGRSLKGSFCGTTIKMTKDCDFPWVQKKNEWEMECSTYGNHVMCENFGILLLFNLPHYNPNFFKSTHWVTNQIGCNPQRREWTPKQQTWGASPFKLPAILIFFDLHLQKVARITNKMRFAVIICWL